MKGHAGRRDLIENDGLLGDLAVNSLGLRRSGSSSQIINQAQDFPEQAPRHRYLGQLERDVPAMASGTRPTTRPTMIPPMMASATTSQRLWVGPGGGALIKFSLLAVALLRQERNGVQ